MVRVVQRWDVCGWLDYASWEGETIMCGIVGYIGPRDATPIILNGLQRRNIL